MGMNAFLRAMAALLLQTRTFWQEFSAGRLPAGREVLGAYAVPVIAVVQVLKFPLVGEPRPAMFLAIATFVIDVAALQLAIGGASRLLERQAGEPDADVPAIVAYAMTPVWLSEPFAFTGPLWAGVAVLAIAWSLLVATRGFEHAISLPVGRRGALLGLIGAIEALSLFSSTAALQVFNP